MTTQRLGIIKLITSRFSLGATRHSLASHTREQLFAPGVVSYVIVFLLIAVPYTLRLSLLQTRHFDQDEFEHLHGAWLLSQGLLPYRDYFEHHTPLFHFLLAPIFWFFDVASSSEDAFAALFVARGFMWVLTGMILLLTLWLGTVWRNTRVGLVGALFLVNTEIFLTTTLEVRPDLLALTCFLGSLVTLIHAVRAEETGVAAKRSYFALSGVLLGAGTLATQKLLFTLPGVGVGMLLYVLDPNHVPTRPQRLRHCAYQVAGFCAPILLVLAYFYLQDGLVQFVEYNVLFNSRFKQRFAPYGRLHQLLFDSPYLGLFGIAALVGLISQIARRTHHDRTNLIVVPSAVGVIGGLFVIPVAYAQYYLLLLPLVAICAAAYVIESVDNLVALRQRVGIRDWWRSAGVRSLVVLIYLSVIAVDAGSNHPIAVTAYWYAALLGALVVLSMMHPRAAVAFFVIAISLPPLKRLRDVFDSRNTDQLAAIRYVIETTAPADKVMDGFSGYGVFRPHAYFFFFPHYGIRTMLTDEDRRELLEHIQSGRIAPTLIVMDSNLRDLSPEITALFERRYRPTGVDDIWRRRDAAEPRGSRER